MQWDSHDQVSFLTFFQSSLDDDIANSFGLSNIVGRRDINGIFRVGVKTV